MKNAIIFSPLNLSDLPLMHRWFNLPHVMQFYSLRKWTESEVLEKMKPHITGDALIFGFIVFFNERPIGYVQKYKVVDFPWPSQGLAEEIVKNAAGMDLFIGEESLLGKGIGKQVVQAFIEREIWPMFKYCIVDPDIKNIAAIKCYSKLSFQEHVDIATKDALGEPTTLKLMILKRQKSE